MSVPIKNIFVICLFEFDRKRNIGCKPEVVYIGLNDLAFFYIVAFIPHILSVVTIEKGKPYSTIGFSGLSIIDRNCKIKTMVGRQTQCVFFCYYQVFLCSTIEQ